jgi:hypothetical protein
MELPLELLLQLGRVLYPVNYARKFALKGNSTVLLPMSETVDCIQWHFERQKDRNELFPLTRIRELCEKAVQTTTIDTLFKSSKRHFLGLWEHAEIFLGTSSSNYRSTTESGAKEERSHPLIVREIPVTWGTSGLGFFGAQFQTKFAWPRAVKAEIDDEEQLLIDRIRRSGDNAFILYDSKKECGWLVPELSLIYELILA